MPFISPAIIASLHIIIYAWHLPYAIYIAKPLHSPVRHFTHRQTLYRTKQLEPQHIHARLNHSSHRTPNESRHGLILTDSPSCDKAARESHMERVEWDDWTDLPNFRAEFQRSLSDVSTETHAPIIIASHYKYYMPILKPNNLK